MKHKIVKGPRKPPKRVVVVSPASLCPCNLDDFPEWVMHNIDALAHMYAAFVVSEVAQGKPLPPVEQFEEFCQAAHTSCIEVLAEVESETATKH